MYYKISEFADMLGITADTIRLYEKMGIVKPVRNKTNRYRYFHDLDARNLLWSRWYRGIGISLTEVPEIMDNFSLDDIIVRLKQKEEELINEIKRSQQLLFKLQDICAIGDNIHCLKDKCKIENIPAFYRLKQTMVNSLLPNVMDKIVREWIGMLPFTFFSVAIPEEDIFSSENDIDHSWGIAITEKEALEYKLKIDESMEFYPEKTCVTSVISKYDSDFIKLSDISHMIDFINDNGLKINGDCMGRLLFREIKNGELLYYFAFHLPIEQLN